MSRWHCSKFSLLSVGVESGGSGGHRWEYGGWLVRWWWMGGQRVFCHEGTNPSSPPPSSRLRRAGRLRRTGRLPSSHKATMDKSAGQAEGTEEIIVLN